MSEPIKSLKQLVKRERLDQVMIRLPRAQREKAKQLAREYSKHERLTESDVYRTAIAIFLNTFSTKSRE